MKKIPIDPASTNEALPAPESAEAPTTAHGRLYQQVVEALRRDIVQGVYAVGQHLPSEQALCERFGYSRQTVREALRELRANGLIVSRRGSGSMVAAQEQSPMYFLHQSGSLADLLQYAAPTRWDFAVTETSFDPALAARLQIEAAGRWVRLEGCRYQTPSNLPAYWTQTYLHGDYAGVARLLKGRTTPIFMTIEDIYGVRVEEVKQAIRGRVAPDAVAALLDLPAGTAVIEMTRIYRLTTGQIAEVSTNIYPFENFSFEMKLNRRAD